MSILKGIENSKMKKKRVYYGDGNTNYPQLFLKHIIYNDSTSSPFIDLHHIQF